MTVAETVQKWSELPFPSKEGPLCLWDLGVCCPAPPCIPGPAPLPPQVWLCWALVWYRLWWPPLQRCGQQTWVMSAWCHLHWVQSEWAQGAARSPGHRTPAPESCRGPSRGAVRVMLPPQCAHEPEHCALENCSKKEKESLRALEALEGGTVVLEVCLTCFWRRRS